MAGIIAYHIPVFSDNKLFMIFIRSIIFVILYFTPVYLLKISPDINQMTNNILAKIWTR
jgi:hypothetical protein